MNEVMTIGGVDCYEKDGTAYLKLEAVARGLGFIHKEVKNGKEYESVRWSVVRSYLEDLGFRQQTGERFSQENGIAGSCDGDLPEFIPENIFYRLAMKAKNETAEKFQALVADEIIPSIRKTGSYGVGKKPLSIDEAFRLMELINATPPEKQPMIREIFSQAGVHIPISIHTPARGATAAGRENPIYSDADGHITVFLQGVNPINRPTDDVYREYAQYCSEHGGNPISNITFSKMVNRILGLRIIDKKVNGRKRRVFVS